MTGERYPATVMNNQIKLRVSEQPVFVTADTFDLNTETLSLAKTPTTENTENRSEIVLDLIWDDKVSYKKYQGAYSFNTGVTYQGHLVVYNLSDKPFSDVIKLTPSGGWQLELGTR